ncbi:hypothetical protein R6Q57_029571 [Mikania cordata]
MGRAKLRMELIAKEKTRNTTYHKRKLGIIKKANEFTILCDVDTVVIIYPPNSNSPEIWPENPDKIKKTIASYRTKNGETGKRTYDLNDFFQDRKKKIEDELVKARKRNMEAKYSTWFDDLNGLTEVQLRQFAMGLENRENLVRAHLELKKRNMNIQLPYMFDHLENKQPVVHYQVLGADHHGHMGQHLVTHEWFDDAPMASFIPLKREQMGFGSYPVFDGGMAYDGVNQWGFQPQVVHGSVTQEHELQVSNGVGEFVMDDHRGRFMSSI